MMESPAKENTMFTLGLRIALSRFARNSKRKSKSLSALGALLCFATFQSVASSAAMGAATEKFFENASSNNALINLFNNSKKTIDIEIYEMEDPLVHQAIRGALARGVRVRVVQEPAPVGETCNHFDLGTGGDAACEAKKRLVREVRAAGGMYVPFNSRELCGVKGSKCFQHGKMVLSDGRFVFMSSGNFNSTSICNKSANPRNCNRDYSILSWDPGVVRTIQRVFDRDLLGKAYDLRPILNHPDAKRVTVSPFSEKPLFDFIQSARESVQVQNQYLKDPELNQVLVRTAQRGVKVFVNVASACSFSKPQGSAAEQWKRLFGMFDLAGVQSRIFTRMMKVGGLPGYLHSKAFLVDGKRAWVGSVNGSESAINNNREFGLFFDDPTEVAKLSAFLRADFTHPDSATWQESLECKKDPRPLEFSVQDLVQ